MKQPSIARCLRCAFLGSALLGCGPPAWAQAPTGSPAAPPNNWFVPAPPPVGTVDVTHAFSDSDLGGEEQITVLGKRRPVAGPLDIPDLPGEDMSRYHREPDYLTREHRAPCTPTYQTVGGHEGRGSSLASGLGAPGCD